MKSSQKKLDYSSERPGAKTRGFESSIKKRPITSGHFVEPIATSSSSTLLHSQSYSSLAMQTILGVIDATDNPFSRRKDIQNDAHLSALVAPMFTATPPRSPSKTCRKGGKDVVISSVNQSPGVSKSANNLLIENRSQYISLTQSFDQRASLANVLLPRSSHEDVMRLSRTEETAQIKYGLHFNRLQSYGASGMTILEELIDLALDACENGRRARQKHHARGAAVLGPEGKVFTGCDVYTDDRDPKSITAEKAAMLAAVSAGIDKFQCVVVASDTMSSFPVPDGRSREFMRYYGNFPVVLVNAVLECQHTSTQELYPMAPARSTLLERRSVSRPSGGDIGGNTGMTPIAAYSASSSANHNHISGAAVADHEANSGSSSLQAIGITQEIIDNDEIDVLNWDVERVGKWLQACGLGDLQAEFAVHGVDGKLLLRVDEDFARDSLEVKNALVRRKLMRGVDNLKKVHLNYLKSKTFDELDEYVMFLESHRLKLVAKLKAAFDRFDEHNEGRLSGWQLEQLLLYMNRAVDSAHINDWLCDLKHKHATVEFSEFVARYSALFASDDPDIPLGEKAYQRDRDADEDKERKESEEWRKGSRSSAYVLSSNEAVTDNWFSERDDSESFPSRDNDRDGRRGERYSDTRYYYGKGDDDQSRERRGGGDISDDWDDAAAGNKLTGRLTDKDILDVKVLAELKIVFDRFAVDGGLTAPETCQALTEAGLLVPRRELAQYLRSRKHLGVTRSVSFFEFIRAFAAIRAPARQPRKQISIDDETEDEQRAARTRVRGSPNISSGYDNRSRSRTCNERLFQEGDRIQARYHGEGRWFNGNILSARLNGRFDVLYDDGEKDLGLEASSIRSPIDKDSEDDNRLSKLKRGDKVTANYRSLGTWRTGVVKRVNDDMTYAVDYDDGCSERNVYRYNIEKTNRRLKKKKEPRWKATIAVAASGIRARSPARTRTAPSISRTTTASRRRVYLRT